MSGTKLIDLTTIHFSSTVFPTEDDLAVWNNLSDEEQMAIIERDEESAYQSGIAPHKTKEEILARVRAKNNK